MSINTYEEFNIRSKNDMEKFFVKPEVCERPKYLQREGAEIDYSLRMKSCKSKWIASLLLIVSILLIAVGFALALYGTYDSQLTYDEIKESYTIASICFFIGIPLLIISIIMYRTSKSDIVSTFSDVKYQQQLYQEYISNKKGDKQ